MRVHLCATLESPKDGLRKLFQMEKSKGIWTQKMKMKLDRKWVIIIDCENGDIVERFPMSLISDPTAFTSDDPRELYNNILVFVVQDDHTSGQQVHAEMHIFQCVRISAQEVVDDIKAFIMGKWKGRPGGGGSALPPPPNVAPPEPPLNGINVREQVSIFNAVSQGSPPTHTQLLRAPHDKMDRGAPPGGYARESNDETSSTTSEKYEREVAILNHCFDDIERFIARLQHAAAAYRELDRRRKSRKNKKKDLGDGMLSMRAKPPPEREFVDILQKFKLSFNLLAKLKNHIHEPNSPELVHFLFTPLAVIVDAARDCGRAGTGPSLASRVVSPLLTRDALELLANCCTSKESDLWHSLGDPWVVPRDLWKGYETETYQPVFSDGWAPDCSTGSDDQMMPQQPHPRRRSQEEVELRDVPEYHAHRGNVPGQHEVDSRYGGSDYLGERPGSIQASPYDRSFSPRDHLDRPGTQTPSEPDLHDPRDQRSELSVDSMERPDPQRQWRAWADGLRDQGAKLVQVVYPRTANNDKELTVVRGEFLEILDDSRKWWKTRNIRGQVGHVPHTIVTPYQDEGGSDSVVGGYDRGRGEDNYSPPVRSPYPPGGAFADMGLEGGDSPSGHDMTGESVSPSALGLGPRGGNNGPRQPPAPADWVRRERQGKKGEYYFADQGIHLEKSIPPAPPLPPPDPPTRGSTPPAPPTPTKQPKPTPVQKEPERAKDPQPKPVAKTDNSFDEELRLRLTLGHKADKKWGKMKANAAQTTYITPESSVAEVQTWLTAKDFSDRVKSLCQDLTGEHMFLLTKERLEGTLPATEVARLMSHLTVQKNLCGYNPTKKNQLSEILQLRRNQVEAGNAPKEASQVETTTVVVVPKPSP
ncbi:epidermal growth factor receptor kinase substrate 8-like protein 1 isoform X1 [Ixodes scapularis]